MGTSLHLSHGTLSYFCLHLSFQSVISLGNKLYLLYENSESKSISHFWEGGTFLVSLPIMCVLSIVTESFLESCQKVEMSCRHLHLLQFLMLDLEEPFISPANTLTISVLCYSLGHTSGRVCDRCVPWTQAITDCSNRPIIAAFYHVIAVSNHRQSQM